MKWLAFVCAVVICLTGSMNGQPDSAKQSAEDMLHFCRQVVNADTNNGMIQLPENFATGRCWGAFASLSPAWSYLYWAQYPKNANYPYRVCAGDTTVTTLIAVFIEYLKRHPERYQDEWFFVATDAAREAFPCPVPKPVSSPHRQP